MAQSKEITVQVHEDLPAFIVGLSEDLLDADLAKSKWGMVHLAKVFDDMSESLKKRFAQEKQTRSIRKDSRHD